jgi:6-phospho-beta-glucosidase
MTMKIAIIGAGSSYTPEIIEELVKLKDRLPVTSIAFMDIDEQRLEIMTGFCQRFMQHLGHQIQIEATTDQRRAIEGSRFVLTQIRVGGNAQRVLDEKIPLKYGVIGQETTGPGGMFKALRTIPVMLEIARDVEDVAPDAWIINYTNPTGLIAEAVNNYTAVTIAGLCAGVYFPRNAVQHALGVPGSSIYYDYFGLNHLNYGYNIHIEGQLLNEQDWSKISQVATWGSVNAELIRLMKVIPSSYLQYYFHTTQCVEQARAKVLTRGETVQQIEAEVFRHYADPAQVTKPEALSKRGGGGYSEIALSVMEAAYTNQDKIIIINVPNRGAVSGMPDDAVLEIPCLVNASGIFPLRQPEVPRIMWGLICAVKTYEQYTVEAAVTGSRETALLALMSHPLVGEYELAVSLLDEMLHANQAYLPQFFG